ncbi:hypothetical protein [Xanthomonas campestris]|uniref:Glycosyltransferase RgtA/B/C/D-like domain-containing protein n=1 Tax=Xanthomonas campestris pv. papavericola TaxID=487881 RepID=A0AAJ2X2W7_XANCA|nr:hypothetical protein [Xanthomonas campestris]MEC3888281.1 hypothetical protein [Xanthomonas campestris pv. papavericola]
MSNHWSTRQYFKNRTQWLIMLVSGICVFGALATQIRYGLNIWDEGFLWYGVQRVWQGEVPIRDFMAYDPGRYYWAAISSLWGGKGILDIRLAIGIFQWGGLGCGLWVLANSSRRVHASYVCVTALTLLFWMFPRHKLFDISLSLFLIFLFTWWIRKPDATRHLLVGIAIGVAACFGRNHGVYAVVGSCFVFGWLAFEKRALPQWKLAGAWVLGIILGFLPVVLACLLVNGFASSFWKSILFLIDLGGTNLPLPIPWPWRVPFKSLHFEEGCRQLFVGTAFIGLVVYPIAGLLRMLRQRVRSGRADAALVATVSLAIPYAHYAFSRADVGHLAQGIFPALLGGLIWLGTARPVLRFSLSGLLLVVSVWISFPSHPGIACRRDENACTPLVVADQILILPNSVVADVVLLEKLVGQYAPGQRSFVATPYWPGAYAMFNRRSPLWEIYATTGRDEAFQKTEISRLQAAQPGFVLIYDFPLDNREELRYSNTHALMDRYVRENYFELPSPNPSYRIYRPRSSN